MWEIEVVRALCEVGYYSRQTSRAGLSSRRPRKRGCRSSPAEVHSENPISATSLGITH